MVFDFDVRSASISLRRIYLTENSFKSWERKRERERERESNEVPFLKFFKVDSLP